jgi:hypothetical protein
MNDLDDRLARLNPVQPTDVPGPASTTKAHGLLQAVLSQPAGPTAGEQLSRRRKPRLAAIVTAGVVGAAVIAGLVVGVSSPRHRPQDKRAPNEQLVAFSVRRGTVIALITNPLAAASQLTAVLRAHGLHITVQTVPVSPSLVGTIVYTDAPAIRTLWKPACSLTGCPVGLVFPAGYTGGGDIAVGRPARPGERYESMADVFAPGEVLHCSGLLGAPAAAALPILRKLGLHATWWRLTLPNWPIQPAGASVGDGYHHGRPAGYIILGDPTSARYVDLDTLPALPRNSQYRELVADWNRGCHQ